MTHFDVYLAFAFEAGYLAMAAASRRAELIGIATDRANTVRDRAAAVRQAGVWTDHEYRCRLKAAEFAALAVAAN